MPLFRPDVVQHASRRLTGEVILAAPLPLQLYSALCIVVLCAALGFASIATYARQQQVAGWVVPEGGIIRVTARASGSVDRILVKEGQVVHQGQAIAILHLSTAMSGGQDTGAAGAAALISEAIENDLSVGATIRRLRIEQTQLEPKVRDLKSQIQEIVKQISNQEQQVSLYEADANRFKRLSEAGIVATRQADQAQTALLSARQSLSQLHANAFSARQQLADATSQLSTIPDQIAAAEAAANVSKAQIRGRQVQNASESTITATANIAGRVMAIPVEMGQVLSSGQTIAIIIPTNAKLSAELFAPSNAIGFVRPGQPVHLMYDAFPYQKFGTASATIASVSHTILAPNEVPVPGANFQQPVFRVRARMPSQTVRAYGDNIPLQPGMLLKANIVFDRRTLMEWLLDPLYAVRR